MIRKTKTAILALHGDLVAEKTAHTRALLDDVCPQWDVTNAVRKKEEFSWLLASKKTKRENSALVELLGEDDLTVTMKAGEKIGTVAASSEPAMKKVGELRKGKDAPIQEIHSLRDGREHADHGRDELQAKLQRAKREFEKCGGDVIRVQGDDGELRELLKKDSADLQSHTKEHWVSMC